MVVPSLRLAGITLLAFALAGCGGGGGGGSSSSSGGGGSNDGGGGGGGGGTVTRSFTVDSFGGAQAATGVLSFQPSATTANGITAAVTAANRQASNADTRSSLSGRSAPGPLAIQRDLPPEIEAAEAASVQRVLQRAGPESLAVEAVSPRFNEIPEGGTTTFFITTTGQTITAQKMHANGETTAANVFAQVVSGNPVINKATALAIDARCGTSNPFDPNTTPIFPRVRNIFGNEWNSNPTGGRDGDTKVCLLLLSSSGIGGSGLFGFFRPADSLTQAQFSTSNQGEILYLNATYFAGDMYDGLATIAHEFQHMCNYNQKVIRDGAFGGTDEDDTINEGLSVNAEMECGFGLTSAGGGNNFMFEASRAYLNAPETLPFFQFGNSGGDYGKGFLMMRYIRDRFGLATITNIATSESVSRANLANATGLSFNQLFRDWNLANALDPVAGAPPQFTYSSLDTTGTYTIRDLGVTALPGISPVQVLNPPSGSFNVSLPAWTAGYVRFAGGDGSDLNLQVQLDPSSATNVVVESPAGSFNELQ